MSICGRASRSSEYVAPIDRTLDALKLAPAAPAESLSIDGARFAACDTAWVSSQSGRFAALFDGRLDNRDELVAGLNLPATAGHSAADLILLAYLAWGETFCSRVIGDFSCALWDAQTRRLVLSCDPSGMRPLFYRATGDSILFASEQRGILTGAETGISLDEDQLVAWLTQLPRDAQRSFFSGICRVPPGETVLWHAGRIVVDRWWHPECVAPLKLKSDADYQDALRHGLEQAVTARLGDDAVIGSNLSGGLDSSAVTAVAAHVLAGRGRGLLAFTAVPGTPAGQRPGWFGDEWAHAAALSAMHPNIEHVRVPNDATGLMEAVAQRETAQDWPLLNPINAIWINAIEREAGERGLRVMLVGAMGNYTSGHHGNAAFRSLLREGRLAEALRHARGMRRNQGRSWLGLVRSAVAEIVPRPLLDRAGLRRKGSTHRLDDYSMIGEAFLRDSGLEALARNVAGDLSNLAEHDSRALRIMGMARSDHLGIQFGAARRLFDVDVRDPTSDRRLVELCLSIPEERFSSDGMPRNLIRQTIKGLVPDIVRNERRRGQQAADWVRIFDRAVPDLRAEVALLRASPLASRALDLDRIDALLDDWREASAGGDKPALYLTYRIALARGIATGRFVRRMEALAAESATLTPPVRA